MFSKKERIITYSIIGLVFVLAFVFDKAITTSLYSLDNPYARIGEMGGEVPTFGLFIFLGALLFRFHPKKKKWVDILFRIAGAGVVLFLSYYGGHHFFKLLNRATRLATDETYIQVLLCLCFFALFAPWAFLINKKYEQEAFRFVVCSIVVIGIGLLAMQGAKMLWLRPRYRTLVQLYGEQAPEYWLPVYKITGFWKFNKLYSPEVLGESVVSTAMANLGIKEWGKEEFYSFYSGHTQNSFLVGLMAFSSSFIPFLKGKERIIRYSCYGWSAVVAVSRIVAGAHNATDVVFGFLMGMLLLDLVYTKLGPLVYEKIVLRVFPIE